MFNPARTRFTSFALALQQGFVEWWLIGESPLVSILAGGKK
jgi:hypothetical protein